MPKYTSRPKRRSRIPGSSANASATAEPKFPSIIARYSSGVLRAKRFTTIGPTAWTRISIGPRSRSISATTRAAAAGSARSAATASAPGSCSRASASAASAGVPPGRAVRTTRQPSRARATAIPLASPAAAPVISARREMTHLRSARPRPLVRHDTCRALLARPGRNEAGVLRRERRPRETQRAGGLLHAHVQFDRRRGDAVIRLGRRDHDAKDASARRADVHC